MRFLRTLDDGRFAVALEILPPQKALPRVLLRRARLLGGAPQAINVIQRPGRQSSLDASIALHQAGIEPAWHLVTRGRSRAEIDSDLRAAATAGIDQVLCILGDHAGAGGPDGPTIREAITMTGARMPGAFIGATLNQYGRDPEAVIRNLVPKLLAGASYIQTQPVFELSALEGYATAIAREAPETRIIAMAMPLLSEEAAERIEERLGVRLPDALRELLATGGDALAWDAFRATLEQLVAAPFVAGVAIMTFEGDAPPETGERILAALRSAGAID